MAVSATAVFLRDFIIFFLSYSPWLLTRLGIGLILIDRVLAFRAYFSGFILAVFRL